MVFRLVQFGVVSGPDILENKDVNKVFSFLLALFVLQGSAQALAQPRQFLVGEQKLQIDLPESWRSVPEIFGLELVFLGPQSNGERPALSVTDLELRDYRFDEKAQIARSKEYLEGRKSWLKKRGGFLIAALPIEQIRWEPLSSGYTMGVRYKLGEKEFVERSFVVQCKSKIYHLKLLLPGALEAAFEHESLKVVRSFSCEVP